jgi:hypothetical protein
MLVFIKAGSKYPVRPVYYTITRNIIIARNLILNEMRRLDYDLSNFSLILATNSFIE